MHHENPKGLLGNWGGPKHGKAGSLGENGYKRKQNWIFDTEQTKREKESEMEKNQVKARRGHFVKNRGK